MVEEQASGKPRAFRLLGIRREEPFPRPDVPGMLVYVIDAPADGVVIPWPKGKTLREAILEWARKEEKPHEI